VAVEHALEELVAEKKKKAQTLAKELSSLMDVKAEEWVNDLKAKRHEMEVFFEELKLALSRCILNKQVNKIVSP
jgi:hypothetical protein